MPSKVEIVRSDHGEEFFGGEFGEVCKQHCIKQEFTNADSPKQNDVVERALGIKKCGTRRVHPSAHHLSPYSTASHQIHVG